MKRSELKLNDFEGFEKFLFTDEERKKSDEEKWGKYMEGGGFYSPLFFPPIRHAELSEIEEYQLCHYAYWMCISIFKPNEKIPLDLGGEIRTSYCYACEYARNKYTYICVCKNCPLQTSLMAEGGCISPYIVWSFYHKNKEFCRKLAAKIAKWPWEDKSNGKI